MELGGVDGRRLLRDDDTSPAAWWETWICGRTQTALHIDAMRVVRLNLAIELIGAAALAWTMCTEQFQWRDAWDATDFLLSLPTLLTLLRYHADPPSWLARWCRVLLIAYASSVAFDLVCLLMGRSSTVVSRSMTALSDAGSLCLWMQCIYYHRELAQELARQAPIAYVTVSASHDQVEAKLPGPGTART